MVVKPGGMPGGIEGPYSSWHPNGQLASRGEYVNLGARSVPEGLWSFWYPDGAPRLVGRYHRGEPQGCFVGWNEKGERNTGTLRGDELHFERCTPPEQPSEATTSVTFADIHLQGMAGPNDLGAARAVAVAPDPAMTVAMSAGARKRLGRLRVGAVGGVRIGNETGYRSLSFGGTAAWELPRVHRRVDTEIGVELGVQRIGASDVQRRMQPGTASLSFWSPLPAAQLSVAFALSPALEAIVGARVDGVPDYEVDRQVVYCGLGCSQPMAETWTIGGVSYGLVLGFRFLLQ